MQPHQSRLLRQLGHDVLSVSENLSGSIDDRVLETAVKEKRVLITNDTDFGEIVFLQKKITAGIVLMRFASEELDKKIETLKHLLKHHSGKLYGHFTVVNERQIRIRPLFDSSASGGGP